MSDKRIGVSERCTSSASFSLVLQRNLPFILLLAIICVALLNVVLGPQYLVFYVWARSHIHVLHALPTVATPQFVRRHPEITPYDTIQSMRGAVIFISSFLIIFVLYFWAIRNLPTLISYRYIQISTVLMGGAYLLIPVLTSQDVLSYTAYARMFVIYQFNPLITPPTAIRHDTVYHLLHWVHQPSVYGPVWIGIISVLQLGALLFGFKQVLLMELLMRIFGLAMHLGSVQLLWLISGRLCDTSGRSGSDLQAQTIRLRATLAFAWSPFLLLEACVNAHNDVTILFLLLLALWCLLPRSGNGRWYYMLMALCLAFAACIKITFIILLPGFLFFLLTRQEDMRMTFVRRVKDVLLVAVISVGLIVVLYAPFWGDGALLNMFRMTPAASRDINSFYELMTHMYARLTGVSLYHTEDVGSPLEVMSHYVSDALFASGYVILCVYAFVRPRYVHTSVAFIGWMACVWLYYCLVGVPWFWPWYLILLFGCLAVLESVQGSQKDIPFTLSGNLNIALFSRALTVSLFGFYCLWNFNGRFHYQYMNSVLIWFVPMLILGFAILLFYRKQEVPGR